MVMGYLLRGFCSRISGFGAVGNDRRTKNDGSGSVSAIFAKGARMKYLWIVVFVAFANLGLAKGCREFGSWRVTATQAKTSGGPVLHLLAAW